MIEISGQVATGFEPVRDAFAAAFNSAPEVGKELGAAFAVWHGEDLIIYLWGGYKDRARTAPWQADTLVPVYSTTKPIAAFVVAMALERAGVSHDAPLTSIWPEFAQNGKAEITIAEALSHQAGLAGFADPIDPALWLEPRALAADLAKLAPLWPPETGSGYHPQTWGFLAGEIVERVAGVSLGTLLRQQITHTPDETIDFFIGTPATEHGRIAEMAKPKSPPQLGEISPEARIAFLTRWAAPNRGGAVWREVEIPSTNGHGTARATARLYGLYANQGRLGGRSLLSPERFAALTRVRTSGQDRVLPFAIDFAAGVMVNAQKVYGPNPNSFGHSGWGGSMGLADPDRGLSAAYVMNQQSSFLQGDPRARSLIAALYGCL
jgi:CubicO group peptidase (beta-lactamase class C family)